MAKNAVRDAEVDEVLALQRARDAIDDAMALLMRAERRSAPKIRCRSVPPSGSNGNGGTCS